MSLDHSPTIDLCCSHCFYRYQLNHQSLPVSRLLALQLQMSDLGAELECPRCKGHFMAKNKVEIQFPRAPHFSLEQRPVEQQTTITSTFLR